MGIWEIFHIILAILFVIASWFVWRGVQLEESTDRYDKERGKDVLLRALICEVVLGFALIFVDSFASSQQRREIAFAVKRAADAEERLAEYRKQRHLTPGQKERIVELTKKFPSIPFVAYTAVEQEPWSLVLDIGWHLRNGGWNWIAVPRGLQAIDKTLPAEGKTVADHIVIIAPSAFEQEAKALVLALTDATVIGMDDIVLNVTDQTSVIIVVVGSKR